MANATSNWSSGIGQDWDRPAIYRIVHLASGRIYVGSTNNLRIRRNHHICRLRRGVHRNSHLQRAFRLYGEDAFLFEPIEFPPDISNLISREQHWMDLTGAAEKSKGYNICPIADAAHGRVLRESHKRKIGLANRGNKHGLGHKHTDEMKAKMSQRMKGKRYCLGRVCSPETRLKMSRSNSGRPNPDRGKPKLLNEEIALQVHRDFADDVKVDEIAQRAGCKRSYVYDIVKHRAWTHLQLPEDVYTRIAMRKAANQKQFTRSTSIDETINCTDTAKGIAYSQRQQESQSAPIQA